MRQRRARSTLALLAVAGLLLAIAPAAGATVTEEPALQQSRFAGATRYETAALIAADRESAEHAVIARGDIALDAMLGTSLAGLRDGPVLITMSLEVPAAALDALSDLGVRSASLIGGAWAFSPQVDLQLQERGITPERIAGPDRFHTAEQVAWRFAEEGVGLWDGKRTVVLANGTRQWDALVAGAPAYQHHLPILLATEGLLPRPTLNALVDLGIEQVLLAGGTGVLHEELEQQLQALGYDTVRIAGANRYETATRFAEELAERQPVTSVSIARGDNAGDGLDALALAAHAGVTGGPLLLTPPTELLPTTRTWLEEAPDTVARLSVAGGFRAVDPEVQQGAATILQQR